MAFPTNEQLSSVIAPLVEKKNLTLEGIKTNAAGKKSQVIIKVDGDTSPDLDLLEMLSQEISDVFDAAEQKGELNFGAGYALEVSTPGVDLPLTQPRHWRRNRGRAVKVSFEGGDPSSTRLLRIGALDAAEQSVILMTVKDKKPQVYVEQLAKIAHAVVEIEFAQPPAQEAEIAALDFPQAEKLAGQGDEQQVQPRNIKNAKNAKNKEHK